MGRKIPGKKHRGVKDPEEQRKAREDKVKKQVNAGPKPEDLDSQEVPKKLLRLMKEKEAWKEMEKRRKEEKALKRENKAGDPDLLDSSKSAIVENRLPGMKRPLKPIPVFRQQPGETQKRFFNRMEQTAKAVIERSKYEDKYGVEVNQDEVTGETRVRDREKDEVELAAEQERAKRLAKKGIVVRTKEEKRQLRRLKEKEKRMKKKRRLRKKLMTEDGEWQEERPKDFGDLEGDNVTFNEVAMQPPSIKSAAKMRKPAKGSAGGGGGKNKKLLLSKKLQKAPVSLAKKHILESERQRVIQEYRKLKLDGRESTDESSSSSAKSRP